MKFRLEWGMQREGSEDFYAFDNMHDILESPAINISAIDLLTHVSYLLNSDIDYPEGFDYRDICLNFSVVDDDQEGA